MLGQNRFSKRPWNKPSTSRYVLLLLCLGTAILVAIGANITSRQIQPSYQVCIRSGDVLVASNQTQGHTKWYDPENAYPGDVIAFNLYVENGCAGTIVHQVVVSTVLPSAAMNPLTAYGYIFSDNGAIDDKVRVEVTGDPQAFEYIPGHVWIVSPKCPSGCPGPDDIMTNGLSLGDLSPGQKADVSWLAYVTNYVASQK